MNRTDEVMNTLRESLGTTEIVESVKHRSEIAQLQSVNQRGGFTEHLIDLSTLTAQETVARPGYSLIYAKGGSNPAGRLTIDMGGRVTTLAPGEALHARFTHFQVQKASTSAAQGTARLIIVIDQEARYDELNKTASDGFVTRTTYANTANSTANAPSAATDGASLIGCTSALVIVSAASGQTLSGAGTIRLHFYDADGLARWVRSQDIFYTVTDSGIRDIIFPVEQMLPYARVYAEARSVTTSSGNLSMSIHTWGI